MTSPLWRESLIRKLIGECRWGELAILMRTMNVCHLFGFLESVGEEIFFQTLFLEKKKIEFILYNRFVVLLI